MNNQFLIDRMKILLNMKYDYEVSNALGIRTNAFNNKKKRNSDALLTDIAKSGIVSIDALLAEDEDEMFARQAFFMESISRKSKRIDEEIRRLQSIKSAI